MRNSMRSIGQHAGVALGHAGLHLDRAAHGVDHAAKFDEELPSPVRLTMCP